MSNTAKKPSTKVYYPLEIQGHGWKVRTGRLKPGRGRPHKVQPIFQVVAEKIPFEALSGIMKDLIAHGYLLEGVYLAHDSMGVARYGGRGQIFTRLSTHKRNYPQELHYFSFYIINDKNHEREIETAILRAAGPQMVLNTRKVQSG
ncbi:hypothetical protein NG895_16660, partial [Aeoliella sp. ICT_H6.2]